MILFQRILRTIKLRRFASTISGSNVSIKVPENELVKDDSEMLQRISINDLPRAQKAYAKKFEEVNFLRITEIFKLNRRVGFIFF